MEAGNIVNKRRLAQPKPTRLIPCPCAPMHYLALL